MCANSNRFIELIYSHLDATYKKCTNFNAKEDIQFDVYSSLDQTMYKYSINIHIHTH